MLPAIARIAALTGAAGSIALTLYVGRNNHSWILPLMFTIWVLTPFSALLWVDLRWNRRPAFYWLAIVVAIASLTIYAYIAFGPPTAKPAFAFLIVPLASWLLIGIVLASAKRAVARRP